MAGDSAMLQALVGGCLIGLAASVLLLFNGRLAGVSGMRGQRSMRGPMLRRRASLLIALLLIALAGSQYGRAEEHAATTPLASIDQRQPLPLLAMMAEHQKQNMREHLAAVEAIVAAIGRDDMEGVARSAGRVGYSEAMGQMCEHMGAAAPGFTRLALDFHHTADGIGEAARHGDRAAVLAALDRTLQACVGCHAAYRQEVVDEATWQRLTTSVQSGH